MTAVKIPTNTLSKFVMVAGSFHLRIHMYSNRSSKMDTHQPDIRPPNIVLRQAEAASTADICTLSTFLREVAIMTAQSIGNE